MKQFYLVTKIFIDLFLLFRFFQILPLLFFPFPVIELLVRILSIKLLCDLLF